ncbi:hypothetical protein H5410_038773 [Solanum commersonii]|uniref:Seipin n=1 Tax=Solanum commersonii TaxID=4109 RepID=A0A9J5YBN9_SOLCO|nr:hypothetical protein H5410_038773 [Solanum commersonii]
MDEQPIIVENVVGIHDGGNFLEHNCKKSPNYVTNLVKYSLLLGAEKVLMGRKSQEAFSSSSLSSWTDKATAREKRRSKGKPILLDDKLACGTSRNFGIESSKEHFNLFDFTSFLAITMLKLFGIQMNILVKLFTFPIFLMNFWIMVWTLPLNTLTYSKNNFKKQLMNLGTKSWLKVMFCWALFWAAYVCFLLVGLLIMGFVVSGLTMRRLLEEPIETTKALNFDYTKTSPVAFAPLASNGLSSPLVSKPKIENRPIPYNHKLQLTVSLTMPESEYNRKLGIFQVRVDCLSSNGEVTATSSYPSMLKFKSQPIRLVETAIKSIPLVTGFQSEVQNLKLVVNDFTEGFEPTACFKVVIEKRAEYQPEGAGIPEIYSATLHVETELPQIKKIIWIWRRTVFVWIGIFAFLCQLSFSLIFCGTLILPGRRIMSVLGNKKKCPKEQNFMVGH